MKCFRGSSPGLTGLTGLTVTGFAIRTRNNRVLAENYERVCILAVTDVSDALLSKRACETRHGHSTRWKIFQEGKGNHLAPGEFKQVNVEREKGLLIFPKTG